MTFSRETRLNHDNSTVSRAFFRGISQKTTPKTEEANRIVQIELHNSNGSIKNTKRIQAEYLSNFQGESVVSGKIAVFFLQGFQVCF